MAVIRTTNERKRRGQMLVLAPFMAMALGAVVSLTSDVGLMAVTQAQLQNTADAAVIAAGSVLLYQQVDGSSEEAARGLAAGEAQAMRLANHAEAGAEIEVGVIDEHGDFAAVDTGTQATAVRSTVFRNEAAPGGPLPMLFASIIGISACEMSGTATCEVNPSIIGIVGNLSPFAVPEDRIPDPGEEMVFYPGGEPDPDAPGGSGSAPGQTMVVAGNWGLLNLDGGANTTNELRDWILNGFDGEFFIDPQGFSWVDGTPGFRVAIGNSVEERIGDQLAMVIYDEVLDQGSNAAYRCVGFVLATVTEVDLTGTNQHLTARIDRVAGIHDIVTGGTYTSPNLRKVQLIR